MKKGDSLIMHNNFHASPCFPLCYLSVLKQIDNSRYRPWLNKLSYCIECIKKFADRSRQTNQNQKLNSIINCTSFEIARNLFIHFNSNNPLAMNLHLNIRLINTYLTIIEKKEKGKKNGANQI